MSGTNMMFDMCCVVRRPSYPAKKKKPFPAGPPSVPPNWFCENGGSSSGLVNSGESNLLLRTYS